METHTSGRPDRGQIRSRDRVRDLAEVYTHEREVTAMLDLVAEMFPSEDDPGNTDRTFLESTCGSGNFLVEILRRKLRYVTPRRYGREERFEHRVLRCIASTYGIDICEDNVAESRQRMRAVIAEHLVRHLGDRAATPAFGEAVEAILETNVIRADTLADAAEIELVTYRAGTAGTFIREWAHPMDPAAGEPSLFSAPPRCDEIPVHYSELTLQPEPTAIGPFEQKAA